MKLTLFSLTFFLIQPMPAQTPAFGPAEDKGLIEFAEIDEASGIAASKKNMNVLWVHNDSGDSARVYAINDNGKHLGVFTIDNAVNRDWEDIAVGPGPGPDQNYIYIAETGDNNAQYDLKYIYRINEPVVNANQSPVYQSLGNADVIKFRYPDGARDAETIFADPLTKDLYIISKRENNVRVYLLSYPQSTIDTIIVENIAALPLNQIVAGDISPDGKEILLKNYSSVYYWQRNLNQTVGEAFTNNQFHLLPYTTEPQGEAICWSYNSDGYYTVSEETFNVQAHLFFYPRTSPSTNEENKEEGSNFFLQQNYPNPFNPSTKIQYSLNSKKFISLKVYNVLGEMIAELINEEKAAGRHEIVFNANTLSSGVYFYKLQAEGFIETKSMTLLR